MSANTKFQDKLPSTGTMLLCIALSCVVVLLLLNFSAMNDPANLEPRWVPLGELAPVDPSRSAWLEIIRNREPGASPLAIRFRLTDGAVLERDFRPGVDRIEPVNVERPDVVMLVDHARGSDGKIRQVPLKYLWRFPTTVPSAAIFNMAADDTAVVSPFYGDDPGDMVMEF